MTTLREFMEGAKNLLETMDGNTKVSVIIFDQTTGECFVGHDPHVEYDHRNNTLFITGKA